MTQGKAKLSLITCESFYCHEVGVDEAGTPIPGKRVLCSGYMEEMRRRYQAGFYDTLPMGQVEAAYRALRSLLALEKAIIDHDEGAADRAARSMDRVAADVMTGVFDEAEAEYAAR